MIRYYSTSYSTPASYYTIFDDVTRKYYSFKGRTWRGLFMMHVLFNNKPCVVRPDGMWFEATEEDKQLLNLCVYCKAGYYGKWRRFWKNRNEPDIKDTVILTLSTPELIAYSLTGGSPWYYPGLEA